MTTASQNITYQFCCQAALSSDVVVMLHKDITTDDGGNKFRRASCAKCIAHDDWIKKILEED